MMDEHSVTEGLLSHKDEMELQAREKFDIAGSAGQPRSPTFDHEDKPMASLPLSKAKFWTVFGTLSLVLSMNGIDGNVLGDIAPRIAIVLETEHVSWLASVALLMSSALILPMGAMYRIIEPRFLLLASLLVMSAGEAIAGSATSFDILIIGRILVGIARGSTIVAAFLLVSLICPDTRDRAIYLSLVTALYGIMIKAGPVIAGAFLARSEDDWRWCFFIQLPIAFVVCTLIVTAFPNFKPRMRLTGHSKDSEQVGWRTGVSAALAGLFVFCLLLPCLLGGTTLSWTSPLLVICYILVLPALFTFVTWESNSADYERLLPLTALRTDRNLLCVSAVTLSAVTVTFASTYFLPIYFQIVYNSSPLRAAYQLLPFAACGTLSCVLVGKIIERTGNYYYCCVVGSVIQIIGSMLFLTIDANTPLMRVYIYGGFSGFGFGSLTAIGNTVALHNVTAKDFARYTAWVNFVMITGASIGIGFQGSVFTAQIKSAAREIQGLLGGTDLKNFTFSDFLAYLHSADAEDPIAIIGRAHAVTAQRWGIAMYLTCGIISLAGSLSLRNRKL